MYLLELPHVKPFAFICHPKTGSRAVRQPLVDLGASCPGGHHEPHESYQRVLDEGGVVACTVRNPFDTMVSWYYYQEQNVMEAAGRPWRSFDEWIRDIFNPDHKGGTAQRFIFRGLHYGWSLCNRVMRFEDSHEDQLNTIAPAGMPHLPVPFSERWATKRRPYQEVYSDWSRKFIGEKFQRDLYELDYSF